MEYFLKSKHGGLPISLSRADAMDIFRSKAVKQAETLSRSNPDFIGTVGELLVASKDGIVETRPRVVPEKQVKPEKVDNRTAMQKFISSL